MDIGGALRDRRLWLALAAVAVVAAARAAGVADFLSIDALREHRGWLTAWVAANPLAAASAFVLTYIVVVALSVPGASVMTLAGGFLFGATEGTLLSMTGATIGATAVFLFARTVFGDDALERFGAPAARLAEGIRRNAASYLLALRLAPLFPFFLVNLVPAFAGVPLLTYVATTFVGIAPGAAVFALAGSGLGSVLDQGGAITPSAILTPQIVAGLLGLSALSLAAIPIRKRLEK